MKMKVLIAQLCPALYEPMDCSRQASLSTNSLGKNTGVGSHFLLQGVSTQGWNLGVQYCRQILYHKPRSHIKSKDITLLTKVCTVIAMVFPVVMYGYES